MRLNSVRWPLAMLVVAFVAAACGGASSTSGSPAPSVDVGSGTLTGAGATFPEPFYTKAFYAYSQKYPNVSVNYQAVGSGAGIQQFTNGTVDFGASDVPMTATELQTAGGADKVVQAPTTLGVVAVSYNVSGVQKLQLDGPTLANIFLGTVKRWDDPSIKALNSSASLPARDITVVHRSDGSGTSYHFTDYLSKVSDTWKTKVGVGKAVQWPAGIGGKGNEGVATAIKQTDGALGYVELAYVIQTGMAQAALKNKAGKFVQASVTGATAAAAANTNVSPTNFSITDSAGDTSYPIAGFSWVILKKTYTDVPKGKAVTYLFRWLVTDGQQYGKDLQYAPLPKAVQDLAISSLKTVTAGSSPALT
jgi:phosphate transport system substrate-binding protein